jgi:DNA modification methylase
MGTGTTGFVCAIYGTKFIGSEKDSAVFQLAESRIVSKFLTCGTATGT